METSTKQNTKKLTMNKYNVQCYYCKRFGHYEHECRKKLLDKKRDNVHLSNNEEEPSEMMFLSFHVYEYAHNEDLWLLDNGYNNHMTGNKNQLSYLDASIISEINLRDRSHIKVEGKGIFLFLYWIHIARTQFFHM